MSHLLKGKTMPVLDTKKDSPLYEQLMVKIKEEIFASKSRAGGQLLSQKAMAQKYDVSLITVKRAMRELAVQGIIVGHARRGTYVARKKTSFSLPDQNVIGLVLVDPPDTMTGLLIRTIEEYAVKKGLRLLIAPALYSREMEGEQIDYLHSMGVSGILAGSLRRDYVMPESLQRLHKVGFPYVIFSYAADPQVKQVCADDDEAGAMATTHLMKTGHHTIGFIGAAPGSVTGELKRNGYLRSLKKHRTPVPEEFQFHVKESGEDAEYASGYEIGKRCAKSGHVPEALFACTDSAALGFQQAMLDHDVIVPAEVAIVGSGNEERALQAPLLLTTLGYPVQQMAALAMEKLVKQIQGKKVKGRTTVKMSLIVRESCGAKDKTRNEAAILDGMSARPGRG